MTMLCFGIQGEDFIEHKVEWFQVAHFLNRTLDLIGMWFTEIKEQSS